MASRHLIGHFLPSAIFGALAPALPGKLMAGSADPIWLTIWRGTWPETKKSSQLTVFLVGGTGARAVKNGLNTTGFPSGVAGVPAEVIETLAPVVQEQRELRTDSGGAGQFRGGLGQATTVRYRGIGRWSISAMVDRTQFVAQGLEGGQAGALGEFKIDGEKQQPKMVYWMKPDTRVDLNPPGGGGYGNPFERDPQLVLDDVVNGYVSIEGAKKDYGVAIHYQGQPDSLVRLPEHYAIDLEGTKVLRMRHLS